MYVPRNSLLNLEREQKGDSSWKRRRPSPYRNKYGMAGAGVLLVLLLLIASLLQKNNPQNQSISAAPMSQDLIQLWSWNERLLEGGAKNADWTVRWDATISLETGIAGLAEELFIDGKGEATDKLVSQEGQSITGSYPTNLIGQVSLHETTRTEKDVSVIVLLEAEGGGHATMEQLQEAAESVSAVVARYSSDGKVTLKSHGYSRMTDGARELERIAMGRVMEQYEDGGTRSVTMVTNKLRATQPLDGYRTANLQVAEHRNTENGKMELTIGIPLLSGEFGATADQP